MPRTRRHAPGGLIYHVMNRSVGRLTLFRADADYAAFVRTLAEAHGRRPVGVLAYCLMPNHWHLVVRPDRDGDLSAFVQWLTLAHAQRWRTSHRSVGQGPLYQGRFKAFAVQDDSHLFTVLRYVERNPVRAKLAKSAQAWPWSSVGARHAGATGPGTVPMADWPTRRPADWPDVVNRPQTPAEELAVQQSIRGSRPFGGDAWQRRTAVALGLPATPRGRGRPKGSKNRVVKPGRREK